ncbi:MAG: YcgL domain-containing protein [Gammaproteobacteria bacterium]|nr:YcgL domain-containing protein [Gammaproteobacteria bacterium]
MKCLIFRCSKKEGMYLYVPHHEDEDQAVSTLPVGLTQITGRLIKAMDLDITPDRKLARANSGDVLQSLSEKGFYLQMPPNDEFRADDSMLNNSSDGF